MAPLTGRFVFLVVSASVAATLCVHAQPAPLGIGEFVRADAFPRSYRELARSYDASVVPQLVELLNDGDREEDWTRITGLLGVVGDEQAVSALIAFVEKPVDDRQLSREHQEARRQALSSLGLLLNRTGSERALTYLIDGLTAGAWRDRNVQGLAPWATTQTENDRLLSEYALYGLALSGHPRAGEALLFLQESPMASQAPIASSTIRQSREVHDLVAERGVAGMYDYYETQRAAHPERGLP
jgi:hypothetical protein